MIIVFSNICAIVFAFEEYTRGGCTDICDANCNENQFMDVTLFLQIVGFTLTALSIVRVFSRLLICPPPDPNEPSIPSIPQLIMDVIVMIYYTAWVIVGFVLRGQLTEQCRGTDKGKMMLAWCIFHIIAGGYRLYAIFKALYVHSKS